MFTRIILFLIHWLSKWVAPTPEELVRQLVLNTAAVALDKNQYIELAPIKGTCGSFTLSGNSLPIFRYRVFDKSIMEFVGVSVQISRPDRIEFLSKIESTDRTEKTRDGEIIETKPKYKEPFTALAGHLYNYFPIPREGGIKNEPVEKLQIQSSGT